MYNFDSTILKQSTSNSLETVTQRAALESPPYATFLQESPTSLFKY